MKKLTAILLAGVLSVGMLAGCGSSSSSDSSSDASTASSTASESGVTTVKDGVLTMATNAYFPPYEYYEGEKIIGIDAEIAQAIADKLGLELKIEDMEFDSIITAVQQGKADMGLAGMTVTEDRLENVNFSDTYAHASQVVIVTNDSEIATVDDLANKTVGVQLGTTGDIYAEDIEGVTLERYNKGFEAVQSLLTGKIDAVIIDEQPAKAFVSQNEGIKILEEKFTDEDYAAAIAKDNTELVEAVNKALASLKSSGKLDEIVAKYITED